MRALIAIVFSTALSLRAHEGRPLAPHDVWTEWSGDPLLWLGLAVSALLYWRGAASSRGASGQRRAAFWSGWLVLLIALVSPVHAMGEVLFSAHMVQHELMMVVAGPLIIASRPLGAMVWGLPPGWRRGTGAAAKLAPVQTLWGFCTRPLHASWLHFAALWIWHIPVLFQGAVENVWLHGLQHISFLGSALLFWWALMRAAEHRRHAGEAALYLFTTMVHTGMLGALLTFSTRVWYPVYGEKAAAWGLSAIEDQQLGGLIMTVPPIAVYLLIFLGAFRTLLRPVAL
jgi:putative membrane protein